MIMIRDRAYCIRVTHASNMDLPLYRTLSVDAMLVPVVRRGHNSTLQYIMSSEYGVSRHSSLFRTNCCFDRRDPKSYYALINFHSYTFLMEFSNVQCVFCILHFLLPSCHITRWLGDPCWVDKLKWSYKTYKSCPFIHRCITEVVGL